MWVVATFLFVVLCGALGGLAQSRVGRTSDNPRRAKSVPLDCALIGAVTAMVVVGVFSQSGFSESIKKLSQPSDSADLFQALMFVSAVSLVAGFTGQTLLSRVSEQLLRALGAQVDKEFAKERKIRDVDSTILKASATVRTGHLEFAIKLLEPILGDSDVSAPFQARAHGVIANAKKKNGLLDEAIKYVEAAHRLLPDDYRYFYNRTCYRWLASNGNLDQVWQDLEQAIERGLPLREIENDEDLKTLRETKRYQEFKKHRFGTLDRDASL